MKFIAKIALASALALSAAPAFAGSVLNGIPPEARTQAERNLYHFSLDGREIVRGGKQHDAMKTSGLRSFAQEPVLANVDRNDPSIH